MRSGKKENIDEIRDKISISDYLQSRGIEVIRKGSKGWCSSPFASDSNWSFCVYPSNTFYCWSTGIHGDIFKLVQVMDGVDFKSALQTLSQGLTDNKYKANFKKLKKQEDLWKDFDINRYINTNEQEIKKIKEYGLSRSICSGYDYGCYFTRSGPNDIWVRNPSLAFVHVNHKLEICGAKFRNLTNDHPRFTTRGKLGFYILDTEVSKDTSYEESAIWLCESETSSNSLWEWFKANKRNAIIISMGGVSSVPKTLPDCFQGRKINLIIDYDGNEELYNQRLAKYDHLNATPIKLILPKGEDINSLFHKNKMYLIENLLK